MTDTKETRSRTAIDDSGKWTDDELDAMKEHAKELKAEKRRGSRGGGEAESEREVLAKIAEMPEPDRGMAERIHAIVTSSTSVLKPKTWYGMPAYAKDGKIICVFQPAAKFKARYASFGFNDDAQLDEGTMWPVAWALTKLSAEDEATIARLVKKAVG